MPLVLINSNLIKENNTFIREYIKLHFGSKQGLDDRVSMRKIISFKYNQRVRKCSLKICIDGKAVRAGLKYSLPSLPPLEEPPGILWEAQEYASFCYIWERVQAV